METKNREKMLLIAVAACVGLYLINLIVITPLASSWSARQKKIADLKTDISNGLDLEKSASSITSQWSRMFTNTLPVNSTKAESLLFKNFQDWAAASRVNIVSMKPERKDSEDPDATYKNEEWHADATGNIGQIFDFLYKVESSPMGLKVDYVEVASRDDRGIQLALSLTVSGLILNPPTNSVP